MKVYRENLCSCAWWYYIDRVVGVVRRSCKSDDGFVVTGFCSGRYVQIDVDSDFQSQTNFL